MSKSQFKNGEIVPENLIINANDWDFALKSVGGNPDKINLIRTIPNSKSFLVIGANRYNGYYTVTHYEYTSKSGGNELENLLKKGDFLDRFGRTPPTT